MNHSNYSSDDSSSNQNTPKNLKILLVDDASSVRLHIKKILEDSNIEFLEAADGVLALSVCKDNADISIIICDVNMPNMDGFTFIRNLKQSWHKSVALPKIIMLTTENNENAVLEGKKLGVLGWIIKPPAPIPLRKFIAKIRGRES